MSGTTDWRGYPIPTAGDLPNGLAQIAALGVAIDLDVAQLVAGYRLLTTLRYTSTGTFAKGTYANIRAIDVEVVGGGGGSAGCAATSGVQRSFGTAGGGGGYGRAFVLASSLGTTEDVGVGAAGAAGSAGGNGGTGGDSFFRSGVSPLAYGFGAGGGVAVAAFGSTASSSNVGGIAGVGGAGDIVLNGEQGPTANCVAGVMVYDSFRGGKSAGGYGGTVQVVDTASAAGIAGVGYGSGGAGSFNAISQSARAGGAGTAGIVVIRVYV